MLLSSIPAKFTIPFANSAGPGYINSIPTLPSATPGLASLTTGFPTQTFQPEASGGDPPYGADFNGILKWITQWNQWQAAGGTVGFDGTFSTAIGGYPNKALLLASTVGDGRFWLSQADNNTSNPDGATLGGTNWLAFPDQAVQRQKPNYGTDSGIVNQIVVTLFPAPAAWADIVGMPVRVGGIVAANSINNPTIKINGLAPATIVNPDGTALGIGQISTGCTMSGVPLANGNFQIDSPGKVSAASTFPYPGTIIPWPNETVPSGWLEMNGATLLISSYANLYAVLGTRYGGDGVTTFKLPDWRGQFVRGWDHGRGLDPNASTRANAGGGLTGDHVGTTQTGAAGNINLTNAAVTINNPVIWSTRLTVPPDGNPHPIGDNQGSGAQNSPGYVVNYFPYQPVGPDGIYPWSAISGSMNLNANSGLETRPTNIYAMWIIKT